MQKMVLRWLVVAVLAVGSTRGSFVQELPLGFSPYSLGTLLAGNDTNPLWWRNGVIYQIYPRSFHDSDGDGIGDIKGISQKLDYLVDLGVSAVWLGPVYASTQTDFGYDPTNMTAVDPSLGTLEDLLHLFEQLKQKGIRKIMDFVPNHTSNKHPWFVASENGEEKYRDYFIWKDAQANNATPNNWLSVMGNGPAWTWSEKRKMYYLHNFLPSQPDLNYRNNDVIKEMTDIIKFWLDRGVDGFRMDAVAWLVENGNFYNEPPINPNDSPPLSYGQLNHIYTIDQPETYNVLVNYSNTLAADSNNQRIMFTESYDENMVNIMRYYKTGVTFPMNLRLITDLQKWSRAVDWRDNINNWYTQANATSPDAWPNWILGNHDQHRVASRFSEEVADSLNLLLMVLKGTAITYMGEELAMTDTPLLWEQVQDVQGKLAGKDNYRSAGRDGERSPFQWDSSDNAGFSSNSSTWLPVNPDYIWKNVAKQKGVRSRLETYKRAVKLRGHKLLGDDSTCTVSTLTPDVLYIQRRLGSQQPVVALLNLGIGEESVSILNTDTTLPAQMYAYAVTDNFPSNVGDQIKSSSVRMRPHSAVILTPDKLD